MNSPREAVLARLEEMGIPYRTAVHPPAATMEACARVDGELGALTPKNLFLAPRRHQCYYLCLVRPQIRLNTSDISHRIGSPRLSFAPEEALWARLRCHGGSASPLGLIFPQAEGVRLILDEGLRQVPVLGFHPCDNTHTLAMATRDFLEIFLPGTGVAPQWIDFNTTEHIE